MFYRQISHLILMTKHKEAIYTPRLKKKETKTTKKKTKKQKNTRKVKSLRLSRSRYDLRNDADFERGVPACSLVRGSLGGLGAGGGPPEALVAETPLRLHPRWALQARPAAGEGSGGQPVPSVLTWVQRTRAHALQVVVAALFVFL